MVRNRTGLKAKSRTQISSLSRGRSAASTICTLKPADPRRIGTVGSGGTRVTSGIGGGFSRMGTAAGASWGLASGVAGLFPGTGPWARAHAGASEAIINAEKTIRDGWLHTDHAPGGGGPVPGRRAHEPRGDSPGPAHLIRPRR